MIVTLSTIALQIGISYKNYRRSRKQSAELQKAQQAYEEKIMKDGIERSRDEFNRLCSLQREIDYQVQQDRIKYINDSFITNLELIAYADSLKNWPLLVPPFVMKNDSLPFISNGDLKNQPTQVAMHCILTNCMDKQFNKIIFPELDEALGQYFCKYWNMSSSHPILYYQKSWRNDYEDLGANLMDLYCHLKALPTVVISPIITDEDGLYFEFNCWGINSSDEGMNEENRFINRIYKPFNLEFRYKKKYNYTEEDKELVLKELIPTLEAFISFIADQYYWNYDKIPPLLPILFDNKTINSSSLLFINDYKEQYVTLFNKNIDKTEFIPVQHLLKFTSAIQCFVDKKNLFPDLLAYHRNRYSKDKDPVNNVNELLLLLNDEDLTIVSSLLDFVKQWGDYYSIEPECINKLSDLQIGIIVQSYKTSIDEFAKDLLSGNMYEVKREHYITEVANKLYSELTKDKIMSPIFGLVMNLNITKSKNQQVNELASDLFHYIDEKKISELLIQINQDIFDFTTDSVFEILNKKRLVNEKYIKLNINSSEHLLKLDSDFRNIQPPSINMSVFEINRIYADALLECTSIGRNIEESDSGFFSAMGMVMVNVAVHAFKEGRENIRDDVKRRLKEMLRHYLYCKIRELKFDKFYIATVPKSESRGFCYITTALCEFQDKSDDCYELTLLRWYRDHWLYYQKNGQQQIEEYYYIGSQLVCKLKSDPEKESVYRVLQFYIQSCINYICKEEYIETLLEYKRMVLFLKTRYNI